MDPVMTAIVSALAMGVASSVTTIVEKNIVDAYGALKSVIKKKFGENSDVVKAMNDLEDKPESSGRKATLNEEVVAAKADQEAEIIKIAQALLEQIKSKPGGEQHIQTAMGNYIAQADHRSKATVNINRLRKGDGESG